MMSDVHDGIAAYQTVQVTIPEAPAAALAGHRGVAGTRGLPAIRVAGGPAFGLAHDRAPSRTRVQDHRGGPAVNKADELSL